jgi:hypothetical protein
VECPYCGEENADASTFCSLCLKGLGSHAAPPGGDDDPEAWLERDATPGDADVREDVLEDAEMWRRRREVMAAERAAHGGEDFEADSAAAQHEMVELAVVEVSVANAAARHDWRVSVAWTVGLFSLACAAATVLAYRFDWSALASTSVPGTAEVRIVAVRDLPAAFRLLAEMAGALFLGGAVASFVGAVRTGELRSGIMSVAAVALLECLVLRPWMLRVPVRTPATDLFTFAVIMGVASAVVGAGIGATIGRSMSRRA